MSFMFRRRSVQDLRQAARSRKGTSKNKLQVQASDGCATIHAQRTADDMAVRAFDSQDCTHTHTYTRARTQTQGHAGESHAMHPLCAPPADSAHERPQWSDRACGQAGGSSRHPTAEEMSCGMLCLTLCMPRPSHIAQVLRQERSLLFPTNAAESDCESFLPSAIAQVNGCLGSTRKLHTSSREPTNPR